jgi:hypothetical protein
MRRTVFVKNKSGKRIKITVVRGEKGYYWEWFRKSKIIGGDQVFKTGPHKTYRQAKNAIKIMCALVDTPNQLREYIQKAKIND